MNIGKFFLILAFPAFPASLMAGNDFFVGSTIDSSVKFNKKENIILALPSSPTNTEKEFVNSIRQYLIDHGFRIEDSIQKADRILTFRITENTSMSFETQAQTSWLQELNTGMMSMQGGTISSNSKDSGYTTLEVSLNDIGLIKSKQRSTIWQALISTKSETFIQFPNIVLENVMKLYGKKEVKQGKIKKPKK